VAWFLRRQKLRTKSQSLRLTRKNDAANVPPFLPQSQAPTPFTRQNWFPTVLAAWTVTLTPLWAGSFSPTTPDNPPFGAKPWIYGVVRSWEPEQPRAQQQRYVPQGAVVAAGQVPYARPWMRVAIDAWSPDAVLVRQLGPIEQQSPADQVPVGDAWLSGILRTWEPELPPRQQARFVPQAAAAAADNPPFAARRNPQALAWEQPWWNAQTRDPQLVLVNDDPPFASRRAPAALAWEQPWWSAQTRDPLVVLVNDDPPYASRKAPAALSWDAPTWSAQVRPYTPQTPAAAVNDPPFASRRAPPALAWEQPWWNAQTRDPLVVLVNDDPPYASRKAPAALSWDAPTWSAQVRPYTPQTPAAAVNNPPFGAKPWVNQLISLWQPIPPERVIYRHFTADNPLTPGVFPPESPKHFRIGLKTVRLGSSNESPAAERLGSGTIVPKAGRLGDEET
jgi:hypothetical protein